MKLKPEEKTAFKYILFTLLAYIVFIILTIPIASISYIGIKDLGPDPDSLLGDRFYEYNDTSRIISCIVFIIAYVIFSTLFLKKYFLKMYNIYYLYNILYIMLYCTFIFGLFLATVIAHLLFCGFSGSLSDKYSITMLAIYFPPIFTQIDFIIGIIIDKYKKRKNE